MKRAFLKALSAFLTLQIILVFYAPVNALSATQNEIREKIVSVASDEIGYTGTSSYSKYGDWYGYQGGWCTTFVLWCFNEAGNDLHVDLYGSIVPSGGNCNSMISWFTDKGRYYSSQSGYAPKSGDLVFFDWSGNGSSQHVGIVDYVSGSTVYTIEGNCSGKVKAREYTKSGSKPYNNLSAIMGYASPNFSSVSGGKSQKPKTQATEPAASAKTTTKKPVTSAEHSENNTTSKKTGEKSTAKTTATAPSSAKNNQNDTTQSIPLKKLKLHAAAYELQVGDSVKLDYSVEPSDAPAVVGYFCDEEGIIELGHNGNIKAVGKGTATVVVCANNELYSQCNFTISEAEAAVTTQSPQTSQRKIVGTALKEISTEKRNMQSILMSVGINVPALLKNRQLYIIPTAIACITLALSLFVQIVKGTKNKM